ncbi:gamma subclass chorismate mutase AroQ [Pseudomonas sp. NPDC007930]|uniref:gamma subclass chorismate mutase AroQ n=1 Tax=Pseudomonas sp. NPDC007930 TaxID=3364417 RepID=UPI0036F17401
MRPTPILLLSTLLATSAHAATTAGSEAIGPLIGLMNERLALALPVAKAKWESGAAVQDRPREHQVLERVAAQAPSQGVPAAWARQLFSAQIEASKTLQYFYIQSWLAGSHTGFDTPARPLSEIRPQLDQLQARILTQMALAEPYRTHPDCPLKVLEAITQQTPDTFTRAALARASAELCASQG